MALAGIDDFNGDLMINEAAIFRSNVNQGIRIVIITKVTGGQDNRSYSFTRMPRTGESKVINEYARAHFLPYSSAIWMVDALLHKTTELNANIAWLSKETNLTQVKRPLLPSSLIVNEGFTVDNLVLSFFRQKYLNNLMNLSPNEAVVSPILPRCVSSESAPNEDEDRDDERAEEAEPPTETKDREAAVAVADDMNETLIRPDSPDYSAVDEFIQRPAAGAEKDDMRHYLDATEAREVPTAAACYTMEYV